MFYKAIATHMLGTHNSPIGSCTNYTPSQNIADATQKCSDSIALVKRVVYGTCMALRSFG